MTGAILTILVVSVLRWHSVEASADPTPVSKVKELLGILDAQLSEDNTSDHAQHEAYMTWFDSENKTATRTVDEASQTIEFCGAELRDEEAKREGFHMNLGSAIGEEAVAQKQLKKATQKRAKERTAFEKAEAELVVATDQFKRSIEVLHKQAPGSESATALLESKQVGELQSRENGLLAVARQLRDTLEHSHDVTLTDTQRATLNGLFRIAASRARGTPTSAPPQSTRSSDAEDDASLSFLQVKAKAQTPYGDFESQTGGLLEILDGVHTKTKEELDKERTDENDARRVFDDLKVELDGYIANKQSDLAAVKMEISQSEQKTGSLKSQMLAAEQLLKAGSEEATNLEAEYKVKTANFAERTAKRADEMLAVSECLKILTSEDAQKVIAAQLSADSSDDSGTRQVQQHDEQDEEGTPPSFLQLQTSPSFIATRSKVRRHRLRYSRSLDSDDPFAKVKSMVRGMLHKLEGAQAEDVKHAAWCDSELAKSTKEKKSRKAEVRKIEDRLEEMDAQLAELADGINTTKQEMEAMNAASAKATELRQNESAHATTALAQYRDAQKILKSALEVMRKFYETEDAQEASGSGFKANGAGSGVIGLLEVALSDYANLEEELSLNEKVAQRDYEDYMASDQTRAAVFQKDLEYKERQKVRLEGDRMRASSDLKSYQKELDAVVTYLEELKASCSIKGDTYDERKDRREKELTNLRSALEYLRSEAL